MTTPTTKLIIASAAAFVGITVFAAAPAFAGSTSENITTCKAAVLDTAEADLTDHRLEFKRSMSRKIYLQAKAPEGAAAAEDYEILCIIPKRSRDDIEVTITKK